MLLLVISVCKEVEESVLIVYLFTVFIFVCCIIRCAVLVSIYFVYLVWFYFIRMLAGHWGEQIAALSKLTREGKRGL